MSAKVEAASAGVAPSRALNVCLWTAQVIVAAMFCLSGFYKLFTPIPILAGMMPWTGQLPEGFVRFIGVVDSAGGLGVLLPALTRVLPGLTVVAAGCGTLLQVLAIGFHLSRGEAAVTPLNFVLLALVAFIFWGRWKKVPLRR